MKEKQKLREEKKGKRDRRTKRPKERETAIKRCIYKDHSSL